MSILNRLLNIFRYVFPWAKINAIFHNSYHCQKYPNYTTPWPTQRKMEANNFVGAAAIWGAKTHFECPIACRPKNHQDWIYC